MQNLPDIRPENNPRTKHDSQRGATVVANRSTGPRTALGKLRSSRNALKSGIFSKAVLLGTESRAEYEALLNGWLEDLQPQGTSETVLVENLVSILWRKRRLLETEGAAIGNRIKTQVVISVVYEKRKAAHSDLAEEGKPQEAQEQQQEPQELHQPQPLSKWVAGEDAMDRFIRYEAHVSREFDRILNQLERVQRMRRGQPGPPTLNLDIG